MYTDSEGIILKQTKTLNGRRMLTVFSYKYGKISAGTSISERGKTKSALALRPFCYGKYELYKNRDSFSVNGAETIQSFYSLGEDVDKYMAACYVLELTDAVLPEDEPAQGIFKLLLEFLTMLEKRKSAYDTLVIGYQIKILELLGVGLNVSSCARTDKAFDNKGRWLFSVAEGGIISDESSTGRDSLDPLIFDVSTDIISMIGYISTHPLKNLEKLAMGTENEARSRKILGLFFSHHLGVDRLKSEGLII